MEKLSPYEEQEFQRLVKSAREQTMAYYEKYNSMQKNVMDTGENDTARQADVCVNSPYDRDVGEDTVKRAVVAEMNTQNPYNHQNMPKSNFLNNIFSRLDTEALLILAIAFLLYKENADTMTILVLVYIALG